MKTVSRKLNNLTLQQKLTLLFALTTAIVLLVNLCIYVVINYMTGRVEQVYVSNVSLNDLGDALDDVQESMEDYLNTKSTEALESYYRSDQAYRDLLAELNTQATDNPILLAQKNIRNLSFSYLDTASEVVQAKRNRNAELYGTLYEEAAALCDEIHTYVYSLNNEQFKANADTYQTLRRSLQGMELFSLVVLIVVILGSTVVILVTTRSAIAPLHQLAKSANEVAKGNFDIQKVEVHSADEVGIVAGAFNQMVVSIRDYIEQLRETMEHETEMMERELMMQSHLKDAQLKYYQAQINPHFLFNTLNAGVQLAMMEGAERTECFLENTAEFFRYNVRMNGKDAALADEIRLVDNYVYILNVRFSGEILFQKEIDESLLDVRVPSMILQPIVENSVNYGIRGLDREGRIELDVYQEGNSICVSIWDNGNGMEEARIREVLEGDIQSDPATSGSNGVGLRNVMERLQLYYKEGAKLEILSEGKDKGTEILITIPKEGSACTV